MVIKLRDFILGLILIVVIYFLKSNGYISFIDSDAYKSNVSQFISLNGSDEYVLAELVTNERFDRKQCTKKILGQCIGSASFDISFEAHYKYHIKLSELTYHMEGDALVFEIPNLYLSTPVGIDTTAEDSHCKQKLLGNCDKTRNDLLREVSGELERKGKASLPSAYDKASNKLADNFNEFAKNNSMGVFYKNIYVSILSENSKSRRVFSFN